MRYSYALYGPYSVIIALCHDQLSFTIALCSRFHRLLPLPVSALLVLLVDQLANLIFFTWGNFYRDLMTDYCLIISISNDLKYKGNLEYPFSPFYKEIP